MTNEHYLIIISFVISLYVVAYIIPKILLISLKKRLFDAPDIRKVHKDAISRLGGISFLPTITFVMGLTIAVFTVSQPNAWTTITIAPKFLLIMCALMILYFVGIVDDLINVRYHVKFLAQVAAGIFIVLAGLWINNLYGIFGIGELSPWIGIPFTVFVVVFVINAINLIDGIDGLASGLSGIALLFFGFLFLYEERMLYAMLAFTTLGVLIPFFYYNVFGASKRKRRIFMGDTGALTIGLILCILAIRLSRYEIIEGNQLPNAIILAFSLLIIPIFDVIRVIIHRFKMKKNIFLPDKNHIHHKFLALGCTHGVAMLIILFIDCFFIGLNLLLYSFININLLILIDVVIWTVFHILLTKKINAVKAERKKLSVES